MDGLNASHGWPLRSSGLPLDPSSADNHIVPIKHCRLAWRDCALWLIELNGNLSVTDPYGCRLRLESVADLDVASDGLGELLNGNPVVITHRKSLLLRIITYDDAIQFRFDANNILRASRGDESFALADSVLVNSGMHSDNLATLRNNRASLRLSRLRSRILLDEVRIRTAFDEANLLGLGFFRCRQSRTPRDLADLRLGQFAQREQSL